MSEQKSSKEVPYSTVSPSSAMDFMRHFGQGYKGCYFIIVYGTVLFVFKEEPQKAPSLRL